MRANFAKAKGRFDFSGYSDARNHRTTAGGNTEKSACHYPATTAYRNFAPEAFELEVVDYLPKPISFERLLKAAVNRYYDRKAGGPVAFEVREETDPRVLIKSERKHHRILRSPSVTWKASMIMSRWCWKRRC